VTVSTCGQLLHIRHGEQQFRGTAACAPFGHLRRLHPLPQPPLESSSCMVGFFGGESTSGLGASVVRGIHSVGPRGHVSAVLCVGRRVSRRRRVCKGASPRAESRRVRYRPLRRKETHRFRSFEFGRQCHVSRKDSASNSGVEFHRLAEGPKASPVNSGLITQQFPNARRPPRRQTAAARKPRRDRRWSPASVSRSTR